MTNVDLNVVYGFIFTGDYFELLHMLIVFILFVAFFYVSHSFLIFDKKEYLLFMNHYLLRNYPNDHSVGSYKTNNKSAHCAEW